MQQLSVVQAAEINAFSNARYMLGRPKQYRFDAGKGIVNINGKEPVTKTGKPFSFVPIAYRIFKDSLFARAKTTWLEFFFIDAKGALSSLMFHGYSVEQFLSMSTSELFYADRKVIEAKITVTPIEKVSKNSGAKYYIADFEQEAAEPEYLEAVAELIKDITAIFRADTLLSSNEIAVYENYPVHLLDEQRASEAEAQEV